MTSPQGTTVRLHDQSSVPENGVQTRYDLEREPDGPGTMDDFTGESTAGTWTASVQDVGTASTGNGYFFSWKLHVTADGAFDCDPVTCPDPLPTEAPDLHVAAVADGAETDLVLTWDPVAAAGHHVLQSTAAPFDADVELLAQTTTETTLTLEDGVHTTPALTFFQVRGVNSCNHEGP